LEDFLDALCRAAGYVGYFGMGGRWKSMEDKSISSVADMDAV